MNQYETVVVLPQEADATRIKEVEKKIEKIVKAAKGEIRNVDDWGLRKLGYLIGKNSRGHYLYVNYSAPAEVPLEVTRILNIDEGILRFNNVRLEDDYDYVKAKAAYMPEPQERERFSRGGPRRSFGGPRRDFGDGDGGGYDRGGGGYDRPGASAPGRFNKDAPAEDEDKGE